MANVEQIRAEHAEKIAFREWRKSVNAELPALAVRVFALRGKFYRGAGFHWCLEKKLGWLLREVNDYDSTIDAGTKVIMQIVHEELLADIAHAEATTGGGLCANAAECLSCKHALPKT